MKTTNKLLFLFMSITFGSCTSGLYVQVLRPAQITMPSHFEKIVVAERTRPTKDNKAKNIIEGILTGEGIQADSEGAVQCLSGVKSSLLKTPRYTVVEAGGIDLRGTGTGTFPTPLTWPEVEKICNDNQADALVVLEVFDSNSGINYTSKPVVVKDKEGKESSIIEHYANMRMNVLSGWRVYDPKNKRIVDEFSGQDYLDFTGKGGAPESALAGLPIKRDAIAKTGFRAGNSYGYRIAPQWVSVNREYYTGGSDQMKKAKRMVQLNDWEGAAKIWNTNSGSGNKKIAKRATYNMAVASEVLGNLDAALEWCNKSYKETGNKKGMYYANVIRQRIADEARVKEQMK